MNPIKEFLTLSLSFNIMFSICFSAACNAGEFAEGDQITPQSNPAQSELTVDRVDGLVRSVGVETIKVAKTTKV